MCVHIENPLFSELRIAYCVLRKGRRDGHVSIALSARKVSVSNGIHIRPVSEDCAALIANLWAAADRILAVVIRLHIGGFRIIAGDVPQGFNTRHPNDTVLFLSIGVMLIPMGLLRSPTNSRCRLIGALTYKTAERLLTQVADQQAVNILGFKA